VTTAPEPTPGRCTRCGRELPPGAVFCGHCGEHVEAGDATPPAERARSRGLVAAALVLGVAALAVSVLLGVWLDRRLGDAEDQASALEADVARLAKGNVTLRAENEALASQLDALEQAAEDGLAPLAVKTLKSVFTVRTPDGTGSGWAAWTDGGKTYVVTAAHVVAGRQAVKLSRRGGSWTGRVTARDAVNDLALIEVDGKIAPPLWPKAGVQPQPSVGETLMLVGSPHGLEGTVTTGIVSRVTYNKVQTDAAANPGNSGGPAVDRGGRVVGVLLSGQGQGLNFVVPIRRACVRIRDCEP
jgi:S1-C subfamily serine protease